MCSMKLWTYTFSFSWMWWPYSIFFLNNCRSSYDYIDSLYEISRVEILSFCSAKPFDGLPLKIWFIIVVSTGKPIMLPWWLIIHEQPLYSSLSPSSPPLSIFSPSLSLSVPHSISPSVYLSSFSFFCSFHLSLSLSLSLFNTHRCVGRFVPCPRCLSARWTWMPRRARPIVTSLARCPNTCLLESERVDPQADDEDEWKQEHNKWVIQCMLQWQLLCGLFQTLPSLLPSSLDPTCWPTLHLTLYLW